MTSAARVSKPKTTSARKDEVIQIRASAETKALINRAAVLKGQKLSEFMLQSARREAEETLLDQRVFILEPEAFDAFVAQLDAPAVPSPKLRELMTRKRVWED